MRKVLVILGLLLVTSKAGTEQLEGATLTWTFDGDDSINFNLTVESSITNEYGWYGVALREDGTGHYMGGADFAVLMVEDKEIKDMYAPDNVRPSSDTQDNFSPAEVDTNSDGITAIWTRSLSGDGSSEDLALTQNTTYTVLWAYGKMESGVMQKHESSTRGYGSLKLSEDYSDDGSDDSSFLGLVFSGLSLGFLTL